MPLQRSRIRSDAKLAAGMGLESAGQRMPGFNRDHIPVGPRLTGFRGRPIEPANMGTSGPVPGRWRLTEGA
eukprot:14213990-Heterocapsa_arctica.AAC.1